MNSTLRPERIELGRFLAVAAERLAAGHTVVEMFSGAVDAEWHRFLDDPGYTAFCTDHAGGVLGHAAVAGAGEISWVAAYEEMFGTLPEIWFTDADGTVDTGALGRYRRTGVVVAEWDCSPTSGDGDDVVPREPEKATTR
ncbi:hypothetical protein [Streptomyces cinerochromogenes]|uniref:hypothetical protein n=1 Tax=Streptomyces cinerochromogenes TaxID=66422 RepID=UPI00166FBF99|nr:hypothetical protein [Streptomyces cinerochromogenes]GGS79409.1 hypothetical protein GCM10010206_47430 [Streptomyces cinerochromogenes]